MTGTDERTFLAALDLPGLQANAHELLRQLAAHRLTVGELKARLQEASEDVALNESRLILSDAYSNGKNAEVRSAWLNLQRTEDTLLATAIVMKELMEGDLAKAAAHLDLLEREFTLAVAELRLAAAQLQFMAGGEQ